jgi:hypothetical protein
MVTSVSTTWLPPRHRSRSGKEVASPPPPPLRTVRAPFDAHSSSIGQRTSYSTRLPALALKTTCTLLRESQQRNRRKLHQQEHYTPPTFLLCFLKSVCPRFTYANTRGKSAGFRRGVILLPKRNPYPPHYRAAFACSLLLYPLPPRLALRSAFPTGRPVGETTGLPRFAGVTVWGRSRLSAGGASTAPGEFGAPGPDHVPFGPSLLWSRPTADTIITVLQESASLACPV